MMQKNVLRTKRWLLALLLVLLAVTAGTAGFFYVSLKQQKQDKAHPQDYSALIANDADKNNMYVTLEIAGEPHAIAIQEERHVTQTYYLLYDKDNYMYVAMLKDTTYKAICAACKNAGDDFSYTLQGYIHNVPSDLKEIILEMCNEADWEIEESDYTNYFGSTYLNETQTGMSSPAAASFVALIFAMIASIVALVLYGQDFVTTKRSLAQYDRVELESELSSENCTYYKKANICLTDRFVIAKYRGVHIWAYQDIAWIYTSSHTDRYKGKQMQLFVHLKNGKQYKTKPMRDNGSVRLETGNNMLEEILVCIASKNSGILVGYTYENLDKYHKIKSGM